MFRDALQSEQVRGAKLFLKIFEVKRTSRAKRLIRHIYSVTVISATDPKNQYLWRQDPFVDGPLHRSNGYCTNVPFRTKIASTEESGLARCEILLRNE